MTTYDYLIIGGGMAADYAVQGIRSVDITGTIGIVSNDTHPPYKRPPLSKALWKGEPLESIWLHAAEQHAEIHTTTTATHIDPRKKLVTDERGRQFGYGKLLLVTGGRVRTLPVDVQGIIYFRTYDDYERLHQLSLTKNRFVIVGGGFTGSEVAAALAMNGKEVTMVFPDEGIGARVYPRRLSQYINEYFLAKGVKLLPNTGVGGIIRAGDAYHVRTTGGEEIVADAVVAGIGVLPNMELAQGAGITTGNGILVNQQLQTSDADIYAAGDVAEFFNPALMHRIRMEHEDNAKVMGEHAGRNMAGRRDSYSHLPFFYSDLFDLGYEAVGQLDSRFEIVEEWKEEFREGVLYYLHEGRVAGVLLWNTWGQLDNARRLIAEAGPFTSANVRGKLPA
jgi:NADPH-dependent 2,4-dienoyl-CoA reductase/sulfur reductase-like enzyme